MVKIKNTEKHPSGAKARRLFCGICGTTKVVPFQNLASPQADRAGVDHP
jgi:hypothetical protein